MYLFRDTSSITLEPSNTEGGAEERAGGGAAAALPCGLNLSLARDSENHERCLLATIGNQAG